MQFKINSKIAHDTIDGEAVIVNFDSGIYYSFDKVGVFIWELLEKGTLKEEIPKILRQHYDGDNTEIESSANDFVAELEKEGLILSDESGKVIQTFKEDTTAEKIKFEKPVLQRYTDMQELLLLDPIDDVDERGWPNQKPKD